MLLCSVRTTVGYGRYKDEVGTQMVVSHLSDESLVRGRG